MSTILQIITEHQFAIAITLHVLSVVIWVGGMFFAHNALRPAATTLLEPNLRLSLMSLVLKRFLLWVWLAIILLWGSGVWIILFLGGMSKVPMYIHIMLTLGSIMTILFLYIFFVPFMSLKRAVVLGHFDKAGKSLSSIRRFININLWLGIITIIVATVGRSL